MSKGGGGTSTPPAAADPFALASAQQQSNITTAEAQSSLNNANVASPFGASWWTPTSIDPSTGRPSGWGLTQQLSPALQQLFGTQTNLAQAAAGGAGGLVPGAANIAGVGQNLVTQAGAAAGQISPNLNLANVAPIQTLTPSDFRTNVTQGPIASAIGPTGALQSGVAAGGPVQSTVNTDFGSQIQQAQNAAYGAQTQYLDPQFKQGESDLRQRLADQGIQEGTPAYSRALGDFDRQKQQAYQSAQDQAVAAGNAQQQALFAQSLGAGQFANQAQQQLFGQGVTQGTFANQAQQQQFAQQMGLGQFANQAQQQLFGQGMNLADLYNQAVLGATGQQNAAVQLGLQQAQAVQQTPLNTMAQLMASGTGAYGAGTGALSGLGSLAQLWPTGPSSIPTMGGTPSTIAPTQFGPLATGAAQNAAANRLAQQQNIANIGNFANLGSQLFTGQGLTQNLASSGGLLGLGRSLFGGGGSSLAGAQFDPTTGGFLGGLAGMGLGIPGIP